MIPKLKKYSFFAACSRVFNITESAFINTVFPIILPPASHYLGAFGTCTRQSAHGAQTKKRTDFSIPFFNPCWFLYKFNFSFCSKATISERNGDERCRRNDPPQAENPAGRILILCKNNFCIISINLNWDFIYSKGFNNCYILLSNISQSLENTKFIAGELSLIVSLALYRPTSVYELW